MCRIEERPCRSAREGFCICAAWWHLVAGTMGTRRSLVRVGGLLVGNKRYPSVELQKARERGESGTRQRRCAGLSALVLVAHSVPSCCAPDMAGHLQEIPNNPRGVRVRGILTAVALVFCVSLILVFPTLPHLSFSRIWCLFLCVGNLEARLFNFVFEVPWKRLEFGQLGK